MADEVIVELKGFDEAIEWLERAPEAAIPLFEQAMERGVLAVAGRLKAYPPATEANQPGQVDAKGDPNPEKFRRVLDNISPNEARDHFLFGFKEIGSPETCHVALFQESPSTPKPSCMKR